MSPKKIENLSQKLSLQKLLKNSNKTYPSKNCWKFLTKINIPKIAENLSQKLSLQKFPESKATKNWEILTAQKLVVGPKQSKKLNVYPDVATKQSVESKKPKTSESIKALPTWSKILKRSSLSKICFQPTYIF